MSYYTDLMKNDVVSWVEPLITKGVIKSRASDSKFELRNMAAPHKPPWHYIRTVVGAKCPYFHRLFEEISPRTPAGKFIPRRCQECWKIVIRPRNLKELFALEELMLSKFDWPCKCGIERRSYAPLSKHRYGGYIYSTSVKQGLERLKKIRSMLEEHEVLNGVEAYLKRGCTEFELGFPDSTKWEVTEAQHEVEDLLDWYFTFDVPNSGMAPHITNRLHMTWIEWAAENGDETYLEYTDGRPLYPPAVRYEPKVEGANEATPDDETVSVGESSPAVPKENTQKKTKKGKKK